jgi:hypothetical protein
MNIFDFILSWYQKLSYQFHSEFPAISPLHITPLFLPFLVTSFRRAVLTKLQSLIIRLLRGRWCTSSRSNNGSRRRTASLATSTWPWCLNGRGGGAAGVVAWGRDGLDFDTWVVIFFARGGIEIAAVGCDDLSISGRGNFKRAEGNNGDKSLPLLDCGVGSR